MLYSFDKDLELCEKFKITPRQLLFIKIFVSDPSLSESENTEKRRKRAIKYQSVFKEGDITSKEMLDLIDKKILIDKNLPGYFLFDDLELTGEWEDKLKLIIYPMADELFDAYPYEIRIQNKTYLAKNSSPEKIAFNYNKAISNSLEKHKEIIELVNWAKGANLIEVGLEKFVDTKYWCLLKEKRSTKSLGESSNESILL